MRCTELQQNHCMNNRSKSSFCTVNNNTLNSNKACISTKLAYLIYDKVKNNHILGSRL